MLFYIKAASEKTPPCSQSFIKQVVFQDKYNMSLSEAENKEWFQNLKQFCTDWYEQDGLLYMNYQPEDAYVIKIDSLEDLCKLKKELDCNLILGYSDYKDIPYSLIIQDAYYG